jgi:hypothetical protein
LAPRLAEGGHCVLLLEAGPRQLSGTNEDQPGINRLPDDYDVLSFHGFASENDAMRWDFFVRHYTSEALQEQDPKYVRDYRGGFRSTASFILAPGPCRGLQCAALVSGQVLFGAREALPSYMKAALPFCLAPVSSPELPEPSSAEKPKMS